jgi:5-methylcytosine-specific restriction endonuclease McrA
MKRTAITKKKTKRLTDYDAEFAEMRAKVMFVNRGHCQASSFTFKVRVDQGLLWTVCGDGYSPHKATQVHHRKYRSRGGTNAESNLIAVCTKAHDWIHAHGGFGEPANLLGLALSAGESEEL